MKQSLVFLCLLLGLSTTLKAQTGVVSDSSYLVDLNRRIDELVMQQDIEALEALYADDFVFSHGTGKIEGKTGWLATVRKTKYPLRQHDSVTVELHPGLALVKGNMSIQRMDGANIVRYHLRYIRVYALRGRKWQMVSHQTVYEKHDP